VISPFRGRYLHRTTQTQKKHRQTSVSRVGFEPTIAVFDRPKAVTLPFTLLKRTLGMQCGRSCSLKLDSLDIKGLRNSVFQKCFMSLGTKRNSDGNERFGAVKITGTSHFCIYKAFKPSFYLPQAILWGGCRGGTIHVHSESSKTFCSPIHLLPFVKPENKSMTATFIFYFES
jgi:hypothetical protein